MSDPIKRWDFYASVRAFKEGVAHVDEATDGVYVTYADCMALVREERAKGMLDAAKLCRQRHVGDDITVSLKGALRREIAEELEAAAERAKGE